VVGLGPGPCFDAGEFKLEQVRGDGNDRLEVALPGELGLGLGTAIGTLADLAV